MIITIDSSFLNDAQSFGELLRNYSFIPDENGGTYGCYSTFKLKPEFKPMVGIEAENFINNFLKSEVFWGDWYKAPNLEIQDYNMQFEMFNNFLKNIYTNGEIIICWYWDGDGCLVIGDGKKVAYNSDCKCDYTWDWMI